MSVCFVGIINIKNDVIWFGKHFPLIVTAHQVGKRRQFLDGGGGGGNQDTFLHYCVSVSGLRLGRISL